LPNEQIDRNPKLSIFYARELFKSGYIEDAEKRLQAAEKLIESASISDWDKAGLRGRIAAIRAYIAARTGDVFHIVQYANQALNCLPQKDLMWRSVAATTLGFGYGWAGAGDLVKAHQAFSEARKISQSAGNLYYNIFAGSCLGAVMLMRAQFKEAKVLSQKMLDLAIENGIEQTGVVGSLYGNIGMILCEWNELDQGIRLIKKGIELSELGRDPVIQASCYVSLLKAYFYRADFPSALKLMDRINECASDFMLPPWITNTIAALNVYIWLATGNLNAAEQWVRKRELSINDEVESLRELEYLALAHILIVKKQLDDADQLLRRLIENAKDGDRIYLVIEMKLWRALVFEAKGDNDAAMGELKKALVLSEPGGLLMIFVSKGKPVVRLLEEIIEGGKRGHDYTKAGFSLTYVKRIVSVFKAGTSPTIEGLTDPISDRELEVLHLIKAGLSNREIAERLFISLNTVKTHTKNINSKLSVNSRIKAVAQAKKLGLL
jgi:LuxR family maltose regulon positive regulatory protein